jgi:hypothetical protein
MTEWEKVRENIAVRRTSGQGQWQLVQMRARQLFLPFALPQPAKQHVPRQHYTPEGADVSGLICPSGG